jgi:hypothetical protein
MTDECGRFVAERAHQPGGVTRQRPTVITARRLVAAAVAAQIHGYHAGAGQAPQLMAPRPPEGAEPVQEDDQWAFSGGGGRRFWGLRLHDVEANPVGVHL